MYYLRPALEASKNLMKLSKAILSVFLAPTLVAGCGANQDEEAEESSELKKDQTTDEFRPSIPGY